MELKYRRKQSQWDYRIKSVTWKHVSTRVFCGTGYCDTEYFQLPIPEDCHSSSVTILHLHHFYHRFQSVKINKSPFKKFNANNIFLNI